MEMKLSLWLWAFSLAVLNRPSESGKSILVRPPNLQCACPNDQLYFNCTIVIGEERVGSTIWSGTAFIGCNENQIRVRHTNENAVSQCKSGTLSARSLGIVDNCTTSELNVTVDSTLNNKTVQCELNSNSGMSTIGDATIMLITGSYQQAPGGVTLTDVRPDQLTFSWSQIDPNCPTVQYQNTFDCGSCSLTASTSTLANCYDLQLSTIARNCSFSVHSEICGLTGPPSNPITVILKVPDAPQVKLIPVYSDESQALTNLIIEIRSQMEPFSIYEGISGSVESFTIQSSSGIIKTIPATDCVDSVCRYMDEVRPPLVCQTLSGDTSVNVSAANRLGPGPASKPITVRCTNRFVTVDIESTASTLTCRFQNDQNTIPKTCRVVYGVCGQEQVFAVEGNSTAGSPDRVTLQLGLPSGTNCYTYTLTAYDGTSTAMVEGRVDLSDERSTSVAAIVIPIVVILILIVVVVATTIILVIWKFHSRDRKEDYHVYETQPDSPENKSNSVSGTNPALYYAKHEHADSGEIEPEDLHRGGSKLSVDKEEQESVDTVPDDNASNALGDGVQHVAQDENGFESAAEDQPDNNSTQSGDDHNNVAKSDNENSNIGGGGGRGALSGYAGDDDEDHMIT